MTIGYVFSSTQTPFFFPLLSPSPLYILLSDACFFTSVQGLKAVRTLIRRIMRPERILYLLSAVPIFVHCAPNPHPAQANAQLPSLSIFPADGQSSDSGGNLSTILSLNASSASADRGPLCDGAHFGNFLRRSSCWHTLERLNHELSPQGPRSGKVIYGTVDVKKKDVLVPRRFSSCE